MAQIKIGEYEFKRKKDARKAISDVLHEKYKPGERLQGEDFKLVRALLDMHPESDQKIRCGVEFISVERTIYTAVGFYLTRTDGTRAKFSYTSCLRPPSNKANATKAFRAEIIKQKMNHWKKYGEVFQCPVTGELTKRENAHLDHYGLAFAKILSMFLEEEEVSIEDVKVRPVKDLQLFMKLEDRDLAIRWREFHKKHARLRSLSIEGHMAVTHGSEVYHDLAKY